jgi:hypothetical protein
MKSLKSIVAQSLTLSLASGRELWQNLLYYDPSIIYFLPIGYHVSIQCHISLFTYVILCSASIL